MSAPRPLSLIVALLSRPPSRQNDICRVTRHIGDPGPDIRLEGSMPTHFLVYRLQATSDLIPSRRHNGRPRGLVNRQQHLGHCCQGGGGAKWTDRVSYTHLQPRMYGAYIPVPCIEGGGNRHQTLARFTGRCNCLHELPLSDVSQ